MYAQAYCIWKKNVYSYVRIDACVQMAHVKMKPATYDTDQYILCKMDSTQMSYFYVKYN